MPTRRQSTLGEKVTVACKKGCVFLRSLGSAPLAIVETKRGTAVIPNAYQVTTFSDGEYWCGETWVKLEDDGKTQVYYKFASHRCPHISSDWKLTPTEAYKECNDRLHTGFNGGGNGQLIIGVTYPSLQSRILSSIPDAQVLLNKAAAVGDTRKRRRASARIATPRKRVSSRASDASSSDSEDSLDLSTGHEMESSDEAESDCTPALPEDPIMAKLNRCFSIQVSTTDSSLSSGALLLNADGVESYPEMQTTSDDIFSRAINDDTDSVMGDYEDLMDFLTDVLA